MSMVRLACVDVADLPLQLLFRKHPEWRGLPAAVVSKDSPYGTILSSDARAKEYGIKPGLRYAAGLSLNHELRADTVSKEMIGEGSDFLAAALRSFSPQVEASDSEPGVFWMDAGGMRSLYPKPKSWCASIRKSLSEQGFAASIAAGYSRFGCYAAAKSSRDQIIFPHLRSERKAALSAGIHILKLPSEVLERLQMLGVRTVGSFLRLPLGGVGKRFGPEAERMYRFAAGDLEIPLQPAQTQTEPQYIHNLPYAEACSERLLGYLRRSIEVMTMDLRARHRLIRELRICFVLEGEEVPLEPIQPSSPSADARLLLELVALRVERLRLPDAAAAIRISASTVAERNIQADFFSRTSSRDRLCRQEVEKVFSRLRAIFGNGCIQRACLEDEHNPELAFRWEDLGMMPREAGKLGEADSFSDGVGRTLSPGGADRAAPAGEGESAGEALRRRRAVRRFFLSPHALSPRTIRAMPKPDFRTLWGPYPLFGHWWRGEQPSDYYYGEGKDGEILWLRFDRADGQWWQIGTVE
jgi:protein ImuB